MAFEVINFENNNAERCTGCLKEVYKVNQPLLKIKNVNQQYVTVSFKENLHYLA